MIVKEERIIHAGWSEYQTLIKPIHPEIECMYGKYQYIFTSKKGKISCVRLTNYMSDGYNWEIYAYENTKLFPDVKRFKTLKQARREAIKYLE